MSLQHQAPWACVFAKEDKSKCKPGRKPISDQEYFEILCLCILQAGLNWGVIRRKWRQYRNGFRGFDTRRLSEAKTLELIRDADVIKNRKKIEAIIEAAKEFLRIEKEHGSFRNFLGYVSKMEDRELRRLLTRRFKHFGIYSADYYLHSVGFGE